MSFRFVADLHGAPAMADVEFDQLFSYVRMTGTINSQNGAYSFHADIYGNGGYGDMRDELRGEQFRIQIQNLSEAGFILTSNPFQSPTKYYFSRFIG